MNLVFFSSLGSTPIGWAAGSFGGRVLLRFLVCIASKALNIVIGNKIITFESLGINRSRVVKLLHRKPSMLCNQVGDKASSVDTYKYVSIPLSDSTLKVHGGQAWLSLQARPWQSRAWWRVIWIQHLMARSKTAANWLHRCHIYEVWWAKALVKCVTCVTHLHFVKCTTLEPSPKY